jgi:hypothetical protein
MDNEAFEHFVADLWERQGWTCEVSQKSRDKSLDVLAERESPYHMRHAIQAKRYQQGNNVGGPTVSEIASLTDYFNADSALVVTTSDFTRDARERADRLHQVKLIDGSALVDMVVEQEAYDLVERYAEQIRSEAASDYSAVRSRRRGADNSIDQDTTSTANTDSVSDFFAGVGGRVSGRHILILTVILGLLLLFILL